MKNPELAQEVSLRWQIFRRISGLFGKVLTASFLQKTHLVQRDIERIHNLIEGIYKPKGSQYALTVASMLKNPYADKIAYNQDRSWFFYYSPKSGSLDSAVNVSLFNCMRDGEPVLVIKQLSDKTFSQGSTYKLLGLGLIQDFDTTNRLFKIRQVTIEEFHSRINPKAEVLSDDLIETALQLEALEEWTPLVAEERAVYKVSKQKRDHAFRHIVLDNYEHRCSVFEHRFHHNNVTEAQAAHIISKEVNGTDDPRNGISLSHTAHWAFDQGIFTISDQYEIIVHTKAFSSTNSNFPILERNKQPIILPMEANNFPHQEALEWHRKEVFGRFAC